MIVLDTNYILRYLLDDNHTMFLEAKKVIDENSCLVLMEVIAEVIYVLQGVYSASKEDIVASLVGFIEMNNISIIEDEEIVFKTLKIFETKNLDFVDCYLCALKKRYKIATFDKKLLKCIAKDG